jgi:protein gp37
MGRETGISWCDHTFNPWWGCAHVSDGCLNCYAEATAARWGFRIWGQDAPRRFFGAKHWNEPRLWNEAARAAGVRRRVFTGSMCDVMEVRPDLDEWRARLYTLVEETPWLDWLFCTHRPENYRRLLPPAWIANPRPNVWLLATVEDAKYLERIDTLKACPAIVHGISVEPLLGPLPTLGEYLGGIDWVIVGGESSPWARFCKLEWIKSIIAQCAVNDTGGYVKQTGSNSDLVDWTERKEIDFKGADPAEWPEDFRVREFPKGRG